MKRLILLLMAIGSIALADWEPYSEEEMIKNADLIVVAKFAKVLTESKNDFQKTQTVCFIIKQTIKGKAVKTIEVFGHQSQICAPQYYFNNKAGDEFFLVLQKLKNGTYEPLCGEWGACQIKDKQLGWYNNDQKNRFSHSRQDLDTVIARIKDINSQ